MHVLIWDAHMRIWYITLSHMYRTVYIEHVNSYIPHLLSLYQHLLPLKFLQHRSGLDVLQYTVECTHSTHAYNTITALTINK